MEERLDFQIKDSPVELIKTWKETGISLYMKREDLLHPFVSGNKFRKLKYNIKEAKKQGKTSILTFGGAYSNHIAAVAAAGDLLQFKTYGIIRGEELGTELEKTLVTNPTLKFAAQKGMELHFISRQQYREKSNKNFFEELKSRFGDFFLIPEGGTNTLAVKGCEEILTKNEKAYNYICTAVGTGGTIAGLINSSESHQQVLGFPALKGNFLSQEIQKFTGRKNWRLVQDYHFGGYGKVNAQLVEFINNFRMEYNIQLDPVYTGKMLFGIFDLIEKAAFPQNSCILAIHTGGLQGIAGMNNYLQKKKLPLIHM